MKTININIRVEVMQMDELEDADRKLVEEAVKATKNSYAKYSHFYVGAALRLEDGSIVIVAIQENAAFPVTLCAERTAIFSAQANNPELFPDTIAIAARNDNGILDEPVTPCGSCRQVMLEMEDRYKKPLRILLYGNNGVYVIKSVKDLMPLCFIDSSMKG